MFCLKCGAELVSGDRFCRVCGAEVPAHAQTIPVQPAQTARKPSAGKVVGIVVVLLLVVGLAVGAVWLFTGHDIMGFSLSGASQSSAASSKSAETAEESEAASSQATDTAGSDSKSAASAAAAGTDAGSDGFASYIGTWSGDFVEQPKKNGFHCYGAKKVPMELTITDVGNSGRVTANVKLLYHSHGKITKADAASTDGDTVIEVKDLAGTMNEQGKFEMQADLPNNMGELLLAVSTVEQANGAYKLKALVRSDPKVGVYFEDSYMLSKE